MKILNLKGTAIKLHQELDEFQIRSMTQQCIRGEVQTVVKELVSYPGFPKSEYLLDIGGSQGIYSIALCQENNKLLARILEQDHVASLTSSFIWEYGMENRIDVRIGDIKDLKKSDTWKYDIVLISNLLYNYPTEKGDVLENISQILNPGGILVFNHRFYSLNCDVKPGSGVREIDRALNGFGLPLCHPEGFKEIFEELGFLNVYSKPYETASGHAILYIGTKEGELPEKALENPVELASKLGNRR